MERRTEFNLTLAINRYVSQVNSSNALNKEDEDELADHLLSEVELLENRGLSIEEAFLISQKRLGGTEMISKEYGKANPWSRILHLIASSVVFIFGYKIIFNLVQVFSISVIIGLSRFTKVDINAYLVWGDLAVQIGILLGVICVGAFFMKRLIVRKMKHFWPIPLVFLLSEIARMGIWVFVSRKGMMALSIVGTSSMNGQYIYFAWILVTVITSLWIILKNKNQRIQLA